MIIEWNNKEKERERVKYIKQILKEQSDEE